MLRRPTKPARLRALHELLLGSHKSNGAVVIIIDEAHLMPPELIEEVRLLMNLDNYPVNVLQVILCGQPELSAFAGKTGAGSVETAHFCCDKITRAHHGGNTRLHCRTFVCCRTARRKPIHYALLWKKSIG